MCDSKISRHRSLSLDNSHLEEIRFDDSKNQFNRLKRASSLSRASQIGQVSKNQIDLKELKPSQPMQRAKSNNQEQAVRKYGFTMAFEENRMITPAEWTSAVINNLKSGERENIKNNPGFNKINTALNHYAELGREKKLNFFEKLKILKQIENFITKENGGIFDKIKTDLKKDLKNVVIAERNNLKDKINNKIQILSFEHQDKIQKSLSDSVERQKNSESSSADWLKITTELDKLINTDTVGKMHSSRKADYKEVVKRGKEIIFGNKKDFQKAEWCLSRLNSLLNLPEDDDHYRQIFKDNNDNWFDIKAKYANEKSIMTQLWNYRQNIVDKMMNDFQQKYDFNYGAFGSKDLGSDIDVAVISHGTEGDNIVFDCDIVKKFNDEFVKKFKAQPGIMFDVNLYASSQELNSIESMVEKNPEDPVLENMKKMANAGQDVGALMKIRRYMKPEEYQKFTGAIDKNQKGDMRKQMEEADALYLISLKRMFDKALEVSKNDLNLNTVYQNLLKLDNEISKSSVLERQNKLEFAVNYIKNQQSLNMAVNNELYVQSVGEVRRLESELIKLQNVTESENFSQQDETLKEQVNNRITGLAARIPTFYADAVFFANEAYHSNGPFKHIVEATQKPKTDVERDKKRDLLTPHDCFQSFNEQFGDMLKDLEHYQDKPAGLAFYRSSKYLSRLLDAMELLQDKNILNSDNILGETTKKEGITAASLKENIKTHLLSIRKGVDENMPAEAKGKDETGRREYAVGKMNEFMNVNDIQKLQKMVVGIAAKVNVECRKILMKEMIPDEDGFRPYFESMQHGDMDVSGVRQQIR